MRKFARLGALVALMSSAAAVAVTAGPALGGKASGWHIGYYTPSGRTLSSAEAPTGNGIASLNFTNQPNTALLITSQKAQFGNLLGNLTGKTITMTVTTGGAIGPFTYYGEGTPSNPCGTPASARFYFDTSNAGGFDYTHYWWSNPASVTLSNGTMTITATVEPSEWSDWNGQAGTAVPAGFAAAASNVTDFGLSFGGGCFFENGVGTTDGSGSFTINGYTTS